MFAKFILLLFALSLVLSLSVVAQTSSDQISADRSKALALIDENKYLDAYPILAKIAPLLPNDVDVWTSYGIAIATRSATLHAPVERKSERKRAYEALLRAKKLGTKNVMALSFLEQMEPEGGDEDNLLSANPEAEKALREGEGFFGKGEYEKAFAAYERAYKLDPKSYEAVLFMGDSLYAQKKYAQSESWFAKAAALDPNREMAFRFWGDALMFQGKLKEAGAKFIEALIADPYSRYSWENIDRLTEKMGKPFDVKGVFPPGTDGFGAITIDATLLSEKDGTKHWSKYSEIREKWQNEHFKKLNPTLPYRHSLKEEVAALAAVADTVGPVLKAGTLTIPHHSISNLIELREKSYLEPYVLFFLANEGISQDYEAYREKNREKLRSFLSDRVFIF